MLKAAFVVRITQQGAWQIGDIWRPGNDKRLLVAPLMRSQIQAAEMSFLAEWLGSAPKRSCEKLRHLVGAQSRAATPWHQKEPVEVVLACDLFAFLLRFSGHIELVGDPVADPEHAGKLRCLIWPGNASWSPRRSWKTLLERGTSWVPCLAGCHCDLSPDKCQKIDLCFLYHWQRSDGTVFLITKHIMLAHEYTMSTQHQQYHVVSCYVLPPTGFIRGFATTVTSLDEAVCEGRSDTHTPKDSFIEHLAQEQYEGITFSSCKCRFD